MKTLSIAILVCLLLSSAAFGGWYVAPARVYAYYPPAPAYVYPPTVVAPPPYAVYAPVVAPAPVWSGPPAVVVRSKVFLPGRPVRNAVRAVLP